MACYAPWHKGDGTLGQRPFACGKCHGCQLESARQWAVRCMHEAQLHDENSFVTLTYGGGVSHKDCNCPEWYKLGMSLCHYDFQTFMKRLRFKFRPRKIGYFMCGEYGEKNSRPHFHACLFNIHFPDMEYLSTTPAGSKVYRSPMLEKLWTYGFSSIGTVNFESAGYVARYAMKKIAYRSDDIHEILDPDTGELFSRTPEYRRMSLRPAVGKEWIKKFKSDVYPTGKVVVNGVEARAPRYYDKFLRATDAGAYMELCHERSKHSYEAFLETEPKRLQAREAVSKARVSLSKGVL